MTSHSELIMMKKNEFADVLDVSRSVETERASQMAKSTWISVAVNIGLSAAQIATGVATASQGLIADGVHSLSDLVADGVVLLANRESSKEADAEHPYGHHRFETAASLILGLLLLATGLGIGWNAIGKLMHPEAIPRVGIAALWVAIGALIAKECLFRYLLHTAKQLQSSMLIANAWHARSDAASSLVVGIGIVGNLAGYPILDPLAAVIVGLIIVKMGGRFAYDALHDLVDRAAEKTQVDAIRQTLLATPGVRGIHDLRTRKLGDMIAVDTHIEVDGSITIREGHDIVTQARLSVAAKHRVISLMAHLDPV